MSIGGQVIQNEIDEREAECDPLCEIPLGLYRGLLDHRGFHWQLQDVFHSSSYSAALYRFIASEFFLEDRCELRLIPALNCMAGTVATLVAKTSGRACLYGCSRIIRVSVVPHR